MRYEWDPAKDLLNRRKHGLRLEDGIPALEDLNAYLLFDDRHDYGEERTITVGMSPHGVLYVVTTERGEEFLRIISVRRANAYEIETFYYR